MKKHLLSNEALGSLCLELSLLLHAGVGVGDGLALMAEAPSAESDLLTALSRQLDDGSSLAAAFRASGRVPAYVCSLTEMGERSGRLEEALRSLAQYYEGRARLDRQLRTALLHPAVMLLVMLAVIVVLLVKVLPLFNDVYAALGGRLTGVAGGLLTLGQGLDRAMPVLCVLLVVLVLFLALFAASASFREAILSHWRRHRGDQGISRKINTARFAQALSMGLSSGLPLEEALDLAASLLEGIPPAQSRCTQCLTLLEEGVPLSKAAAQSAILPPTECRLLELGLKGGSADTVMEQIAQRLLEDSEASLAEKVGQVEPALVLVTSLLVGMILLAVMLPLMHIMSAMG